jgi:hypothetical protein
MMRHELVLPADSGSALQRVATAARTWSSVLAGVPLVLAIGLLAGCGTFHLRPTAQNVAPPPPPPPPAIGKLAPSDVQTAFGTGVAFTEAVVGGKTYMVTFNADGSATRTPMGSKTAETGSWRAADPGYCAKWGTTTTEQCYTVNKTAATTYDVLDNKSKVIAHLSM